MKTSKDNMIHVGPDWALSGDETCITLYKRRITKSNKARFDPKGYFNNLTDAFIRMVDLELNPLYELEDIVEGIDNLKKWIKEVCDSKHIRPIKPSEAEHKDGKRKKSTSARK